MKYLFTLFILLPLTSTAQNFGIYIDTAGQVAIGKDTVWEPFQVFADAGPQLQLDQQSVEMGNTAGLLITSGVENGQSITCGLTGQLVSVSLRLGTVIDAGNTMLDMNIREGSAPTGTILRTSSFAISDDEMQWYDIALTPFIDVMAGDEFFIEVVHTGGDQAEWDWEDGTDAYSGGTSWQNQTSWLEIASSDFVFRTYVVSAEKSEVLSVTSTGKVKINDYLLPQFDGLNNQVMVTDGTGVLAWQDMSGSGGGSVLQDADGDTKIQVEESADEDIIRFDLKGEEKMVLRMNALGQERLEFGSGTNTAIGKDALIFNSGGSANTAMGYFALRHNSTGSYNTAIGSFAMRNDSTGAYNTAVGSHALVNNLVGPHNTATGASALHDNISGSFNTANGSLALRSNTIGNFNTAVGLETLWSNVAGSGSTAIGYRAMYYASDSTAPFITYNTAVGYEALRGSTTSANNKGFYNTAIGYQALLNNSSGFKNTANGYHALFSNTQGLQNTAIGNEALRSNISGVLNTAVGSQALHSNIFGSENTAIGMESLFSNTKGSYNTAIGRESLYSNKAGAGGTAIGYYAMLYVNDVDTTFFNNNVAVGYAALRGSSNPSANTGNDNTAVGYSTLFNNTSGAENTANGGLALFENTSGNFNTASGFEALRNNEDGWRNTATGHSALNSNIDGDNNTAVGIFALEFNESGSNNTALGYSANSNSGDFSNSTGIGYDADPTESNSVRIGNDDVTSIGGAVNWDILSDGRFKTDITEDVVGLDFINELRPVTYNIDLDAIQAWKALHNNKRDSSDNPEKYEIETYRFSGFIAQEVESASRNAGYDFSGVCPPKHEKDSYSLRYAEFVVPLVKAVQELSDLVGQQQQLISHLQSTVSTLEGEVLLLKNEH